MEKSQSELYEKYERIIKSHVDFVQKDIIERIGDKVSNPLSLFNSVKP